MNAPPPERDVVIGRTAATVCRLEDFRAPSVAERDPGAPPLPSLFLRGLIVACDEQRLSRRSELPWLSPPANKHVRQSVRLFEEQTRFAGARSYSPLSSGSNIAGGTALRKAGGKYQYHSLNKFVQGRS